MMNILLPSDAAISVSAPKVKKKPTRETGIQYRKKTWSNVNSDVRRNHILLGAYDSNVNEVIPWPHAVQLIYALIWPDLVICYEVHA